MRGPKKATFWVVIQANRDSYASHTTGIKEVKEVKAKQLFQQKPTIGPDQEAVEVEIEFPAGYFDSNSPKVIVTVPDVKPDAEIAVTAHVKPKSKSAAAAVIHR